MSGRLHPLRIALVTGLIVLLGFQTSPAFAGLNLCIGIDGHVEIESEDGGCCPSRPSVAVNRVVAEEEDSCSSCIDVSLGGSGEKAVAGSPVSPAEFSPSPPFLLERLKPSTARPLTSYPGRFCSQSQLALRSIVLRV